jgi:hypothetical protein
MCRFALEADSIRLFEGERLAMRLWARHDDRDAYTLIRDRASSREAADHHETVVVEPLSPLEVLDRALGSGGGDPEWELTLARALEQQDGVG